MMMITIIKLLMRMMSEKGEDGKIDEYPESPGNRERERWRVGE